MCACDCKGAHCVAPATNFQSGKVNPLSMRLNYDSTKRICRPWKGWSTVEFHLEGQPYWRHQVVLTQFDPTCELRADYWERFCTFIGANSVSHDKQAQVFLINLVSWWPRWPLVFARNCGWAHQRLPGVAVYLSDVLVSGSCAEDHLKNLRGLLQRFSDKGLRCRVGKYKCTVPSVEYLDHLLSKDGIASTYKLFEPHVISRLFRILREVSSASFHAGRAITLLHTQKTFHGNGVQKNKIPLSIWRICYQLTKCWSILTHWFIWLYHAMHPALELEQCCFNDFQMDANVQLLSYRKP